jgi:hypothetical protein
MSSNSSRKCTTILSFVDLKSSSIDFSNLFFRVGRKEFALQEILDELQLEYLDLFLIHWPMGNSTGKYNFDYLEVCVLKYSHCHSVLTN